ncbi:MAG: NHLP family bacteriocin export ABC transporter peptidase/permease/ATPase subunit [Acidimicrobiia bacterium]|nr:NHLP family bacteriocin export ABC transporter peptidase/permease/ATPase subunit [Acidimicrobiia bacterium]
MEAAECGAACLGIVLAHLGRWVPIEALRDACFVGRDGSSAADIVNAGKQFGLRVTGYRCDIDKLYDVELPAILFWEFNHFLVLEGHRGRSRGGFYLNDPANGRRFINEQDFGAAYTGIVLCAEPTADFRRGGEPRGIVRALWPWLATVRSSLAFAVLTGLLIAVPGLAVPVLLRVLIDWVLVGGERSWGTVVVAATVVVGVFAYALNWLQQFTLRKIAVSLSVTNAERMLWRLFRLPTRFFANRFAGDLTARVQIIDNVANASSRNLVAITIELATSVLLLALMLVFDWVLALIVAATGIANIVVMRLFNRLRKDENRQVRREQALLLGLSTAGLRDIDSLRATAREDDFFVRWSGYQARELAARQKFVELGYVIAALPALFLLLGSMAVLGFGGWRVSSGAMTVGTLVGFYVLAGNFLVPIGRFVSFADILSVLEADLSRVNDVLDAPEDPSLETDVDGGGAEKVSTLNGRLRLAGHIELRDVTFGYQANREPLIKELNLTVKPGQRVAIIGPTGSGKSTVLRLISGELTPDSGEIRFDGVTAGQIPRKVFTSSVASVDQHICLFSGTVRDNLTMWNPTIGDQQMVDAAGDALIHDQIMSRASGYDSAVQEGGRNFSGGQRQRLEIARALVGNPSVLFLDEATSTLDAVTEERIDDALRRRGCTCVIVAHRLSTIRDCDQIVVLERGREVQRGTHETLLSDPEGVYSRLIGAHETTVQETTAHETTADAAATRREDP